MPILHKNINNPADIHNPKWFDDADNGDYAWRNEKGVLESTDELVLPAALDFVDGSVAPPTSNTGDIYVLSSGASVNAAWGSVALKDWVRYDGTAWNKITPQKSSLCYDKFSNSLKSFNGIEWAAIGGGISNVNTAEKSALSPITGDFVYDTDLNALQRYDGSVWVTIAGYTKSAIRGSSGELTFYSDLKNAYDNSSSGDVIEVYASHTIDCGGIGDWTWSNSITINLNGNSLIVSNLDKINVSGGVNINMTNGSFEVQSNTANIGAFNFAGDSEFIGDGAINVFCNVGSSSLRGSFWNTGGGDVLISNVIMKGSHSFCVLGCNLNDCTLYTDQANNDDALYGNSIIANNCTIYGNIFTSSGDFTIPTSAARILNNCTVIGNDGDIVIGGRQAIFNNCSITSLNSFVRNGIGGEQEYHNCTLERTGTADYAVKFSNTGVGRFYNTNIKSTGPIVRTNIKLEFYGCNLVSYNNSCFVYTTNAGTSIIDNCYFESTGGDVIQGTSSSQGLYAIITNTTLISNTAGEYCLTASTGSYYQFANLALKNTANSADVYSRASLTTDNPQTNTPDSFNNIILD